MTDKPQIILLGAKAWREGFAAGRRGLKWNANPYPAGTDASRSWQSGLLEGQTKPLRSADDKDNPWESTLGDLRAVALTPGEDSVSE